MNNNVCMKKKKSIMYVGVGGQRHCTLMSIVPITLFSFQSFPPTSIVHSPPYSVHTDHSESETERDRERKRECNCNLSSFTHRCPFLVKICIT